MLENMGDPAKNIASRFAEAIIYTLLSVISDAIRQTEGCVGVVNGVMVVSNIERKPFEKGDPFNCIELADGSSIWADEADEAGVVSIDLIDPSTRVTVTPLSRVLGY